MLGKREFFARTLSATGFTSLLEQLRKQRSIIVLNYHRIGYQEKTQYDPGVFSATPEEFEWQVTYLKRHFEVTTVEQVVAMIEGQQPIRPSVLITFDDGYRDNYELAFPILRAAGLHAAFFLPTAFIGSSRLPWWDLIAYIVRHARRNVIRLSYPRAAQFDVSSPGLSAVIAGLLRLYKDRDMTDHDRFIAELKAACDSGLPTADEEACFMSWEQAREMQDGGMAFGSHTHSHEILGKLPVEKQVEELHCSRQILERELGRPVRTLSYPVGGRDSFTKDTQKAAKDCGYVAAFSFYGGFNLKGKTQIYDIRRYGVEQLSQPRFRAQLALGAVSGKVWL